MGKYLVVGACVAMSALLIQSGHAAPKELDWAAMNPAYKGARYVKDAKVCLDCHDTVQAHWKDTAHAKAFKSGKIVAQQGECETCHGPRSNHAESDEAGRDHELTPVQMGAVCMQCHDGGDRKHWKSSAHASGDNNCSSCHTIMQKKSERNLLTAAREEDTCYKCHSNVRGETNKSSHHPIREGKMNCSSCHNSHGSVTQAMLKGNSVNETCFQCHQEKRGPFLWEHAPVRENCLTCHEPHGSNNRKLQAGKDSFLCLQCHTYGGHINLPRYDRTSNPVGEGCVNCHITVHGSNSPSGRKLTR